MTRRRGPVALTFDDGPWAEGTGPILHLLALHGAPATFFIWGRQASSHPDLVRRIVDAGHSVQPHCFSHASHHEMTPEQIRADLDRVLDLLTELGVPRPHLWRPPYGQWRKDATDVIARERGLGLTGWTIDTRDFDGRPATQMNDEVLAELDAAADGGPEAVVLMHDCPLEPGQWAMRHDVAETVELLRLLLEGSGRRFVAHTTAVTNGLDSAWTEVRR